MATYSLIIPMYNGEKYIANALGSLLPSASFLTEVILVDDRSTDDGVKVAHTFDNLLPMRYFVTDESMDRGPGNARQLGLDNACGEWIGFMDADDLLAPDALRHVDNAVSQCEDAQMFIGNFIERDPLTGRRGAIHQEDPTWVHGKWYLKKMLDEYDIRFLPNLYTHEDIYFNALVFDRLRADEKNFYILDELIYYWNQNPNSMTSSERYTLTNLNDYLISVIESHLTILTDVEKPSEELVDAIKEICLSQYVQGYFYYQAFIYKYGSQDEECKRGYESLKAFYKKLTDIFHLTRDEFLDILFKKSKDFCNQRNGAMKTFGPFIEVDSLPSFIYQIAAFV